MEITRLKINQTYNNYTYHNIAELIILLHCDVILHPNFGVAGSLNFNSIWFFIIKLSKKGSHL